MQKANGGFALIVVLWIIAIVVTIALSGAYIARIELRRAHYPMREMQALGIALAGVEEVKAALYQEEDTYTSLNQKWKENPNFNDTPFGEGTLAVVVDDEEGKLNLNIESDDTLSKLFAIPDGANEKEMLDSFKDWKDSDSIARDFGAEEDYYQSLNPPYHCKNKTLDSLDELYLIKGFENKDSVAKIIQLTTLYSDGKININTASAEILSSLPGIDVKTAETIVAYRNGNDQTPGTQDDIIFKKVSDVRAIMDNDTYNRIYSHFTIVSSVFKVRSTGKIGRITKTVEAVLTRTGKSIEVLYWREL